MIVQVQGMTCDHCKMAIERAVGDVPGVDTVSADHRTGRVEIAFAAEPNEAAVRDAIEEEGYEVAGTSPASA